MINMPDAYASRDNSYSAKGDFDRALPDFNKAIGIQQTAIYYNGRGYAYARKKVTIAPSPTMIRRSA